MDVFQEFAIGYKYKGKKDAKDANPDEIKTKIKSRSVDKPVRNNNANTNKKPEKEPIKKIVEEKEPETIETKVDEEKTKNLLNKSTTKLSSEKANIKPRYKTNKINESV